MGHVRLLAAVLLGLVGATQQSAAVPVRRLLRTSYPCLAAPQAVAAHPSWTELLFRGLWNSSQDQALPLHLSTYATCYQHTGGCHTPMQTQFAPAEWASVASAHFSTQRRTAQAGASPSIPCHGVNRSPLAIERRRPLPLLFVGGFAALWGSLASRIPLPVATGSLRLSFCPTEPGEPSTLLLNRLKSASGMATLPQLWRTSSSSPSPSALSVYRNKIRHINPVRRIKHMKRDSGRSHVNELARERYLLHRQKDVRDYYRIILRAHEDRCPHSQRNAAVKKPDRGVNEARRRENARLNAEDDERDRQKIRQLTGFLDGQKALVLTGEEGPTKRQEGHGGVVLHGQESMSARKPGAAVPSGTEQLSSDRLHTKDFVLAGGRGTVASFEEVKKAYEELQAVLRKRRMLRPLGSHKLFISGVDSRLMNSDLEDFFDFFFDTTKVRLHKNADGTHRGSGIIRFQSTLDATQCLLEFNGVQIGDKRLFLGEALGPPIKPRTKRGLPPPPFPYGAP